MHGDDRVRAALNRNFTWEDGSPSDLRCTACGTESPCPRVMSATNLRSPEERVTLYACPCCRSYFYHPQPNTSYLEGYPDMVTKYQLMQGISLEFGLAAFSALFKKAGRLLDVGCGPGFMVDFWERLKLGMALGIEPSLDGNFARCDLHHDIHTLHLDEDTQVPDGAFDVVLSTEVLEHVSDPRSFLQTLSKKVSPDGTLILSTPHVGLLGAGLPVPINLVEALSPGFHVTLFSETALRSLLEELGWPHIHLIDHEGHWLVYATKKLSKLELDFNWASQMHQSYLELACHDDSLSARAREVFTYRLFRKAANEGNWAQADDALSSLVNLLPPEARSWCLPGGATTADAPDATLRSWLKTYFHLPTLFYLLGIRAKNHLQEITTAIQLFQLAHRVARLANLYMFDDAYTKEIYWVSQLNAGITLLESGKESEGMEILQKMGSSTESKEQDVHLPQLRFATRARLEIFKHQVQTGQWQTARLTLSALQEYLSSRYHPSLLQSSAWLNPEIAWPEGWDPFWYFYCESMLMLNLGHNTEAADGFSRLHELCKKMTAKPEGRHFLPLSLNFAEMARQRKRVSG